MHISKMEIENYRTFRDVVFQFNRRANYLVGDNNIGKSNFLSLLETACGGRGFIESDFLDADKPIQISFFLSDSEEEGKTPVCIELTQHVWEVVPVLRNKDTGEPLPLEYVRRMYCIRHSLQDVPRNMIGEGEAEKIIRLFTSYLKQREAVRQETEEIRTILGMKDDFSADPRAAALQLMYAIYGSDDSSRASRSGVQIMMAVGVHLMVQLMERKESRAVPFDEIVVTDRKGKRYLPIMVCIDEPELHLHPYLQRAALSFCRRILSNEEPFFQRLVKEVLGIDGLDGQLFVVTHSTDALVNDYRQIIRLYRDGKRQVQSACGSSFLFDSEIEKHLIMHFPEVKESLYARCAILVEGETEYGAFSRFAATEGIHFDYYGICLINARGESSISKIAQLLRKFFIPSVCLYDRDVKGDRKPSRYIFYTDQICFEMDVVRSCLEKNRRSVLDQVIQDMADGDVLVSSALIKKACQKLAIPRHQYTPRKLKHISGRDRKKLELYYFAWFYGNKGVIAGRALGMHLKSGDIPRSFRRVIEAAVNLAERGIQ